MNSELKVGMPAMIIGCLQPKNSYLIGSIVMVEALWKAGEDVTPFYPGAAEAGVLVRCKSNTQVVVSDCKFTNVTKDKQFSMQKGWTNTDIKFLMPLPPLDDDAKLLDTETPKETEKC